MNVRSARSALTRQLVPGVILATSLLIGACSGAAAAPTVAPVTAAPPSPVGPTSWADWIDHQGFGAQNGPNEVRRLTRYLTEHAGATTLFDLDTTNDNTVIQAPANAGSLSPTGKLGVDAAGAVGFDIYSDQRDGTTTGQQALASIATSDGATSLYRVELLTGRATGDGAFSQPVVDIAIPTAQH